MTPYPSSHELVDRASSLIPPPIPYTIHCSTYTIVAISRAYDFHHNVALSLVNTYNGYTYLAYISMPKVRAIADDILGYRSQSVTELNDTFISWALGKTYLRYSHAVKNPRQFGQTRYNTGWTIL